MTAVRGSLRQALGFSAIILALAGHAFGQTTTTQGTSIVVLGDIHYDQLEDHDMLWLRSKPEDLRQVTQEYVVFTQKFFAPLRAAVQKLCSETVPPVEAIVQTGDLQEGLAGSPAMARQMTQHTLKAVEGIGSTVPLLLVKGNHDITGPGAEGAYEELVLPFLSEQLKQKIDKPYYSWTKGDVQFICVDSYFLSILLPFLEDQLAHSTAKYRFIALHEPLVPATGRCWHVLNAPEEAARREKVLELVAKYKAVVLCGHMHRYSVLSRSTKSGPVVQIMVNTVIREADRDTAYSETRKYGPELVDLEPGFSPSSREKRREILAAETPFITNFREADMPGIGVISIDATGKMTFRLYAGLTGKIYDEVDLTALLNASQKDSKEASKAVGVAQ